MFTLRTDVTHRINLLGYQRSLPKKALKLFVFGMTFLAVAYLLVGAGTLWAADADVKSAEIESEGEVSNKLPPLPDYSKYKLTEDENLKNIKDDDYERIVAKVKAEEAENSQPAEIDAIEEELKRLDEAEEKVKAAEQKESERRLREESARKAKEMKAFEQQRKQARQEMESEGEDAFPEIGEDEINWNGLYD